MPDPSSFLLEFDEDEIELEQQERKRRQMLNREFKAFAEKIAEASTQSVSVLGLLLLDNEFLIIRIDRRYSRSRHPLP